MKRFQWFLVGVILFVVVFTAAMIALAAPRFWQPASPCPGGVCPVPAIVAPAVVPMLVPPPKRAYIEMPVKVEVCKPAAPAVCTPAVPTTMTDTRGVVVKAKILHLRRAKVVASTEYVVVERRQPVRSFLGRVFGRRR